MDEPLTGVHARETRVRLGLGRAELAPVRYACSAADLRKPHIVKSTIAMWREWGWVDEVERLVDRAEATLSASGDLLLDLARMRETEGRRSDALRLMAAAVKAGIDSLVVVRFARTLSLFEAIDLLGALFERDPTETTFRSLTALLIKEQRLLEVEDVARKRIASEPRDDHAWTLLTRSLLRQRRRQEALIAARQAAELEVASPALTALLSRSPDRTP